MELEQGGKMLGHVQPIVATWVEMEFVGDLINEVISNLGKKDVYRSVAGRVEELCKKFPRYPELQA